MTKQEKSKLTHQERSWSGPFGEEYIKRNSNKRIYNSNLNLFSNVLNKTQQVKSILELGCNIGLNLECLNNISKNFELTGVEINKTACNLAKKKKIATIINSTIIEKIPSSKKYDLVFTKGVLIHINPNELEKVYKNIYEYSLRYIFIAEYYNPEPVSVDYRGQKDLLFKRDFAGELIDKYKLNLVDYGFIYHRDKFFPKDDINWFLLEK